MRFANKLLYIAHSKLIIHEAKFLKCSPAGKVLLRRKSSTLKASNLIWNINLMWGLCARGDSSPASDLCCKTYTCIWLCDSDAKHLADITADWWNYSTLFSLFGLALLQSQLTCNLFRNERNEDKLTSAWYELLLFFVFLIPRKLKIGTTIRERGSRSHRVCPETERRGIMMRLKLV